MDGLRLLAISAAGALGFASACAFHTSGSQPGQGGGGSSSSSSSTSSASSATSTSTSTSTSSTAASSGQVDKCTNGVLDPGEADVDCGGACPRCTVGKKCGAGGDCDNSLCFQGFCCQSDCSGACSSCAMSDTGVANGTCAPVTSDKSDPEGRCAKGTCDGAGQCHCTNAKQDFDETSTDCGGSCGKCQGEGCGGDGDCQSTHCSDGVCCNEDCGAKGACYACGLTTTFNTGAGPMTLSWVGTCTPAFSGAPGKCAVSSYCGADHACHAGGTPNNQGCSSDGDCASGYCAVFFDWKCHPKGPAGDPCIGDFQCFSDSCDNTTHVCQ